MTNSQSDVERKNLLIEAVKQIEVLKTRLKDLSKARNEAIAIVGIGCRFPGGVDSPESFWQLLQEGRSPQSTIPPERWDMEEYYHPDPAMSGKTIMRSGYFLENVDLFDAPFFQISPREAGRIDPQQRILLEVAWEALENAGIDPSGLGGTQTGVFMGYILHDYASLLAKKYYPEAVDQYYATGNSTSTAVGRISYLLGAHGPCIGVDTACSSSLVAAHLACQSLRLKECDIALTGGVNIMFDPIVSISLSRGQMLAPDGRCKTFDASANGYARGEGCAVLVLKRLSDAVAQRDPIWAVIRGSAVNQDGSSSGLTVPNGKAQTALIRQALNDARLTPEQIQYVEAHGTGTALGDPIEIRALGEALTLQRSPDNPLYVGSVKTNIGHLEAAAGVAGLVKAALALHFAELPPHLHFKQPSPQIPWDEFPIHVPTTRTALPAAAQHFVGVSSFGVGGTNAHLILAGAPPSEEKSTAEAAIERPYHILTLSAKTAAGLRGLAAKFDLFLSAHPEPALADVCYTANTGRAHYAHRAAFITESLPHADAQLSAFSAGYRASGVRSGVVDRSKTRRIGFMFTGQGSQYPSMGKQLYDSEPTFRQTIDLCNELLKPFLEQSLLSVLFPNLYGPFMMDETAYTQPVLFSLEYALARMMMAWGIDAEFLIGHSLGEYVAACLAGVFSLEDALRLIAARGRLMQALPKDGSMAAILADEATVLEVLKPYAQWVSLAAVNTPSQVTISGRKTEVDLILAQIASLGIDSIPLNVSHAFHSPLMEKIQPEFLSVARQVTYHTPDRGLISNVSGSLAGSEVATPEYWSEHIRKPVLFAQGIHAMAQQGCNVMVELGPHPTLTKLGPACLGDARPGDTSWFGTLRRGKLDWPGLLQTIGDLYTLGCAINWKGFDNQYTRHRIHIPTYAFQHQRCWPSAQEESKQTPDRTLAVSPAPAFYGMQAEIVHPYLGKPVYTALDTEKSIRIFDNDLGKIEAQFWQGSAFLPAAVWLEMALAAGKHSFGAQSMLVENITLARPFALPQDHKPGNGIQEKANFVQSLLQPEAQTGALRWSAYCAQDKNEKSAPLWQLQGQGYLRKSDFADAGPAIDASQIKKMRENGEEYYRQYSRLWIDAAANVQVVTRFSKTQTGGMGEIELNEKASREAHPFVLAPAVSNCAIQAAEILAAGTQTSRLPLLRRLARIEVYGVVAEKFIYFIVEPSQGKEAYDCTLFSSAGIPIARFIGMEFELVSRKELFRIKQVSKEEMEWLNELISWRVDRP